MGYSQVALEEKILEMYPDIQQHGMELNMRFDEEKDAWIIKLKKGGHGMETHLEKKDADSCMDGLKCVYLGVQVEQFIKNFEEETPGE